MGGGGGGGECSVDDNNCLFHNVDVNYSDYNSNIKNIPVIAALITCYNYYNSYS